MKEEFESYFRRRVRSYDDLLHAQMKALRGELIGNMFCRSGPDTTTGGINTDHKDSLENLIELHKLGILTDEGQGNQWEPRKGNYQRSYLLAFCPGSIGRPLCESLKKDERIYVRGEDQKGIFYDNFKYDYQYNYKYPKTGERGFVLTIDVGKPFTVMSEEPALPKYLEGKASHIERRAGKIFKSVPDLVYIQVSVRHYGTAYLADKIVLDHVRSLSAPEKRGWFMRMMKRSL